MSKFKPGQSGNPRGRPRKGQATADRLRAQIADDVPEIINQLREAALGGDVQAAKLLLDRCIPALKPIQQTQPVAAGDAHDLLSQGKSVINAMQSGQLPPEQAKQMLDSLVAQAKLIEHTDFDERLAKLEAQQ